MSSIKRKSIRGMTYLELLAVIAMLSLTVAIALPSYQGYADRAKNSRAMAEIGSLQIEVERFRLRNQDRIPADLNELGIPIPTDPWGRDYVFLNIRNAGNIGVARKDGRLNPLNTDFDLYSIGKDGESALALNAQQARDDIVRANNGDFIGLGKDY